MPFEVFDRSRLKLLPLGERVNRFTVDEMLSEPIPEFNHPSLEKIANAITEARKKKASVILMYGAHVIRRGCAPFLIRLMEEGLVTHFATNGAGAIHDFEFALIGQTCESVAKYISEGQFGLWRETGIINDALKQGCDIGLGAHAHLECSGAALSFFLYIASMRAVTRKPPKMFTLAKIKATKPKILEVQDGPDIAATDTAIKAPTMITEEIALVTLIRGVCSAGVTLHTTK